MVILQLQKDNVMTTLQKIAISSSLISLAMSIYAMIISYRAMRRTKKVNEDIKEEIRKFEL